MLFLGEIMKPLGILTLCNNCNKEFPIEFEENVTDFVAVFAKCPHCQHVNQRWLRFSKNSPWMFIEKEKLTHFTMFFDNYPSDIIPRSIVMEKAREIT